MTTQVVGYERTDERGNVSLHTFEGKMILAARCEVVGLYRTESYGRTEALVFRLTNGRAIVGYSLGDGMLFRGELTDDPNPETVARDISRHWIERDAEDDEAFDAVTDEMNAEECEA